jgi:hypothetical protein
VHPGHDKIEKSYSIAEIAEPECFRLSLGAMSISSKKLRNSIWERRHSSYQNDLVGARRTGTIVPRKIVPIIVPFRHGLKEAMATNLRRERHARETRKRAGRSGGAEFSLSRFD